MPIWQHKHGRFGGDLAVAAVLGALGGCATNSGNSSRPDASPPGAAIEHLPWPEAEKLLTPDAIVVIPLGAASIEHGPHLPLNSWYVSENVVGSMAGHRREIPPPLHPSTPNPVAVK